MNSETPVTIGQCLSAVRSWSGLVVFFNQVGDDAQNEIAVELMALVNSENPSRPVKSSFSPAERLERFRKAFSRIPSGWPGIAEMAAIYCQMFPPGDGRECGFPTTPGYTAMDHEAGTHVRTLPRPKEQPLIGPADEPLGQDFILGLESAERLLCAPEESERV